MNTQDAKRVLETALICAPAPLPLRELLALFDEQLGADTLRSLMLSLRHVEPKSRALPVAKRVACGSSRKLAVSPSTTNTP